MIGPNDISPVVLRNQGVPVEVYRVKRVEEVDEDTEEAVIRWRAVRLSDGEREVVTRHVRFGTNEMISIEQEWGNFEAYEVALRDDMRRVVRKTLAIAWGWDEERVGEALTETGGYTLAIGTAISIANGVDPTLAVKLHRQGLKMQEAAQEQARGTAEERIAELVAAAESGTAPSPSPGDSGPPSGPSPDDPGTSSSASAPPRSSSSSGNGRSGTDAPGGSSAPALATSSLASG